ncbi:type II secretion system F family protein [Candidatus Micrarchaeota archaeon]|nr:type II secretion system F family protein [Candidatus Micrarchaeota archaeon]
MKEEQEAKHPYISKPVRRKKIDIKRSDKLSNLAESIAAYFPNLEKNLKMAKMDTDTGNFVIKVLITSVIYTFAIIIALFAILFTFNLQLLYLLPGTILLFTFMFFFWMSLPAVKMLQRARKIDQDIVFAGRHIVIALKSGIPFFDAMVGVTEGYGAVSEEFNKIIEDISLGKPETTALREAGDNCPSKYFNRVILQMVNAIVSGTDIAVALDSTLDQIAKEQVISLKAYGQKLNPLSMFFMLFGIIFPSLGVVFLIVILSFAGGEALTIAPVLLPLIFLLIVAIQFSFVSIMESSRPRFELT